MTPSMDASGQLVGLADAFDVPVFVRHSSPLDPESRPRQSRVDHAAQPWPGTRRAPRAGNYLIPTTWREVLDAAMTVGRDPLPWLAAMPGLASAEIIARRSPLAAYLHRTASVAAGQTGYQLEPNAVYREGTEKTARAMFGYRIGMTMAEWACRGLMGLGPTVHAEATTPPGYGPVWSPAKSQPDLVAYHWHFPETWLVEAKGYRRLGKTHLRNGARQLSVPGLMKGPHMRMLCGTSIEHRVFMTIDIEAIDDGAGLEGDPRTDARPSPDENDEALVVLASSRMLNYHALQGLPRSALTVRPVGAAIGDERRRRTQATDLVFPLEGDQSTSEERASARDSAAYMRRPPSSRLDMLTARIPGTDLVIGMSRRLFAACRRLDEEHATIRRVLAPYSGEVAVGPPPGPFDPPELFDEGTYDDQVQTRRAQFAELEDGSRDHIRAVTRQAYEDGKERDWGQLIALQPQMIPDSSPGLLESATADTYIAIDTLTSAVSA
jgi:hypothetical protein